MGDGIAISYYMMHGKFDGCIKCSMRYNSAVAYKIPYVVVRDCKDMDALNGAGISLFSVFSLIPAKITIAIVNPTAVAKPLTIPSKREYSF